MKLTQKLLPLGCVITLFLAAIAFAGNLSAEKYNLRSPIRINGNGGFVAANGVVGGSGTSADPWIIENWEISGSGTGYGIYIGNTTDYFVIRNCYIHDASGNSDEYSKNAGIFLYNVINGKIENNTVSGCELGVYAIFSSGNTLSGNTIHSHSQTGVHIYLSDSFSITGNNISDNCQGILLESSSACEISSNTFYNDGVVISGASIEYWNTHEILPNNTVNGRPLYYYKDMAGISVSGGGEVIVANCTNFTLKNQVIQNTTVGILIGFSSNIKLENSTVSYNRLDGIRLYSSNGNSFNTVITSQNGGHGIYLEFSNWNKLNGCTANNNRGSGIYLVSSSNNSISGASANLNTVCGVIVENGLYNYILNIYALQNTEDGILLTNSLRNTIAGCTITGNIRFGIELTYSDENTISGNNASDNFAGIRLYHSNFNSITNNIAINQDAGINLNYSSNSNTLSSNYLEYNNIGIFLLYSTNNNITSNSVLSNHNGIMLLSSNQNTIIGNEFLNNTLYAINVSSGSSGNSIHHNNFISNGAGKQCADNGTANAWNTSIAGNYWNDWLTPDANGDGIVDNPYILDGSGNARDFYPLTNLASLIQMDHTPLGTANTGQAIVIVVGVKSVYNVSEVKLYYKAVGSETWYALTMTRVSGNATYGTYQCEIPAQQAPGTLYYYIKATDEKGESVQTDVYSVHVTSAAPELSLMLLLLTVICGIIIASFRGKLRKNRKS
ncbi:MAG: NosD domain-containing protein [Thermoplasmata archaeon]